MFEIADTIGLIDTLMIITKVIEDKTIVIMVVKKGVDLLEVKQIKMFMVVGVVLIMRYKKEIQLILMAKLLVVVFVNQYITGLRSSLVTTPRLPFLPKRHRNVL